MQISPNKNFGSQRIVFKAMPQKEVLQRTRKILQNEQSKKLFVKLSTLAGLTGLVSIVTSFLNKGIKADDSNIEALKKKYNDINNSYLTNPDTVGVLLDITSSSDSKDAEIRTKGATNKTSDTAQSKTITSSIDITPEELEVFLEEANGQKLNTILEQTETLSINPNGEIISKSIDKKITDLAVEAEKLRKEENSSALYNAFAEIAKKLSISSFVDAYSEKSCGTEENKEYLAEETCAEEVVEEKISQKPDKIEDTETEKQESFTPIVLPENEKVKLKVSLGAKPRTESEFFVMIKSYDKPDTIQIYNTLASIYNEICGENRKEKRLNNNEEVKNSKLVEIISKRVDAIKTLKPNNQKIEIEKLLNEFNSQSIQEDYVVPAEEEKIYTPDLFRTEILEPRANSDGYELLAKTFDKYSALICSVYNSIPKENLKESFLTKLSEKDRSEELNQYIKFGGQQSKLDFMSYLAIVDFKHSQGLDLTLSEFRELESYKDTTLKYSTYDSKDGKTSLYFREDADFAKRFETAVAYFKALYSIRQGEIVKPSLDEVTKETLINELKKKISKDSNEYENLLNFIGLKLKPNFAGQKLSEEGIQSLIDAQLKDEKTQEKFNLVLKSLQSQSFEDFVQGTHGRMRFIERIVLDDNISTDKFETTVEAKIKNIKREVATRYPIILTKYETNDDGDYENKKYSPQLKLGNYGKYIIGLNSKGQIHTIYPAKNHKNY